MRILSMLAVTIAAAVIGACSGSDRTAQALPVASPVLTVDELLPGRGLPDVFTDDPSREQSALLSTSVAGFQCEIVNGGTEKDGYKMALDGAGSPAWAIGRLNGLSTDPQVYVQARMNISDVDTDETYYRLMADFGSGRWDVQPINPDTTEAGIDLLQDFDPARHISANGNTYVGLLTAGSPVTLDLIFFDVNVDVLPPTDLTAAGSADGSSIGISWVLPELWESYSLYAKLSSETDDDYVLLLQHGEELPDYTHDLFDFVLPCQYGMDYDYRMTTTIGGEESAPSAVATARRELPAPELRVSQGLYGKRILARWDMPAGSGSLDFDVYRDNVLVASDLNFILNDGGYFADNDVTVHDGEYYSYHVVARGSEGNSPPSAAVEGYAALIDTNRLVSFDNLFDPHADVMYTAGFSSQPVIVYYNQTTDKLVYHKYVADGISIGVPVADAQVDLDVSGLADFNRPWIAYDNHDDTIKAEGLWIARGQDDNPSAGEWDDYLLFPGDISGERVHMRFIDGVLAVIFSVRVNIGEYEVKYAYALNDDPQSAADWKVKDMLPAGANTFPDVMMMRQLDDLPLVVMALNDQLLLLRAQNSAPSGPANWDQAIVDASILGDRDLDFVIRDDIVSISVGGCQAEGSGDLRFYRCSGTDPLTDPFDKWVIGNYNDDFLEMADLFYRDGVPHLTVPYDPDWTASTFVLEGVDDPFLEGNWLGYYHGDFEPGVHVRYFSRMFADSGTFRTAYLRSWDNSGDEDWGIYVATTELK